MASKSVDITNTQTEKASFMAENNRMCTQLCISSTASCCVQQ